MFAAVYDAEWKRHVPVVGAALIRFAETDDDISVNRPVLDVCCGTGHVSCHLANHGFDVVGIDASPHMIGRARENAEKTDDAHRLRFAVQDATEMNVGRGFGLAVSTLDAMNHLTDLAELRKCFSSVRTALAPGGVFVFDMHTVSGLRELNRVEVRETPDTLFVARTIYDPYAEVLVARISGCRRDGATWQRFTHSVRERAYPSRSIEEALHDAGFDRVHAAEPADLHTPLPNADDLPRAFYVARNSTS
ncbi:class I SAM-dependent methyltransferase [Actinomadura sp. DC4]|uniref:class I SAM-dependent methyltransferase n=1 Tax=Actinomadura sp. DC4 TaxID=3055069 RepID=UPI0025B04313|nr:class I SAM-dependent methyltransferase [Actinomadura sp. DC4]